MFGYMTEREAAEKGFTHNGKYYFLPIYINPDFQMVAVKFMPFDYLFDLLWWFELNFTTEGEIPNFVVLSQFAADGERSGED